MSESKRQKNKDKKTKKTNKIFSVIKVLIISLIIIGFIGAGATAGLVFATIKDIEPVDPSKINQLLDENSVVLDSQGNVIEKIQRSGLRTLVEYDSIDDELKNAFLATEDRTFFEHSGFNFKRLVGAVLQGLRSNSAIRGTSTISQQLARNLYLPHIKSERSIDRKIKEAYYAIQLERYLTKEQIFEAYMNTIYLGSGAKGVQAAAQVYFSKDATDLDLVESALIAGITQSPANHSPLITKRKEDVAEDDYILDDSGEIYTVVFNENSLNRFHSVLSFMKVSGYITEKEYEEAKAVDLKTKLNPGKLKTSDISSYFTDLVKDEVIEDLVGELEITREQAEDMLYTQGLQIYSTLDVEMQRKLERIYDNNDNFPALRLRKDKAGNVISKTGSIVLYNINNIINSNKNLVIPNSDYKYTDNGDLLLYKNKRLSFIPLYENSEVVGIRVSVTDTYKSEENEQFMIYKGGTIQIPSEYKSFDNNKNLIVSKEFLTSNSDFFKADNEGNLLIANPNYSISEKGSIQPQSSMVIMDYTTGEVVALVGGRNIKGEKLYNRAINPRQPGSAIKPISIYTPAIDNNWTAASIIDDIPNYDASGNVWPRNWYNGYYGLSTIREAIQWSMNVPAVKMVERLGVSTSIEYLKKMGVSTLVESGPRNDMNLSAMGLGGMTHGITPLDLTAAYGSLANKGIYIQPHTYTKVTDRNGNVLLEHNSIKNYVISPQAAFIMTDMMKSGVESGTGTRARMSNMPVAGKTGTTSDNYDAWFVGYTPYYVGAVWIGNDLQIELESGSKVSAMLWKEVMEQVHQDMPRKEFERPDGVIQIPVDIRSGKLPTLLSYEDPELGKNSVRYEYFIEGTQPTEYDDVHVEFEVDIESGKLPTEYCPPESIEKRVFINRPIPYYPEENNGLLPDDYQYSVPTEYCDIHNYENSFENRNIDNFPPGTITLPNGTKLLPDGRKVFPDGTILFPDGTIVYPSDNNEDVNDTDDENEYNEDSIIDSNENNLIDNND